MSIDTSIPSVSAGLAQQNLGGALAQVAKLKKDSSKKVEESILESVKKNEITGVGASVDVEA